jgi:tRNA(fMet)-specific endonuclease VapC
LKRDTIHIPLLRTKLYRPPVPDDHVHRFELKSLLEHESVSLVAIGKVISDRYSRIAAQLKRQGTPIPSNDIWIAAQPMKHGGEIITFDQHSTSISGLVCTIFDGL